jgi:hypothetical protein
MRGISGRGRGRSGARAGRKRIPADSDALPSIPRIVRSLFIPPLRVGGTCVPRATLCVTPRVALLLTSLSFISFFSVGGSFTLCRHLLLLLLRVRISFLLRCVGGRAPGRLSRGAPFFFGSGRWRSALGVGVLYVVWHAPRGFWRRFFSVQSALSMCRRLSVNINHSHVNILIIPLFISHSPIPLRSNKYNVDLRRVELREMAHS